MAYGRYLEEFTVGEVFRHWPGRTISEADCTWFALLTIVSGRAIANLEIEKITHDAPVFIGDTLYAESTVLDTRESKRGDRGTVTVETRVKNQRGERVMTFRRTALVPKKNHRTLGERAFERTVLRSPQARGPRSNDAGRVAQ